MVYHQRATIIVQSRIQQILSNVGSIKCMVESQYISNHDFLEGLGRNHGVVNHQIRS
ncbi:hypothetical protein PIB30_073538 [Stylosanthes scabra]|uniref:Uncharacterized protein n=1 Tax=Stylosanthes scabra TaxID=79078 RepID=A0ABU6VSU4_9FABA|nr:hypothetical protein [Stylosanthes scabra]